MSARNQKKVMLFYVSPVVLQKIISQKCGNLLLTEQEMHLRTGMSWSEKKSGQSVSKPIFFFNK
jgi:hypothetical protein